MDVLPIRRGGIVETISNTIGINLEDDTWTRVPYIEPETDSVLEAMYAWVVNHEFQVWTFMLVILLLVL